MGSCTCVCLDTVLYILPHIIWSCMASELRVKQVVHAYYIGPVLHVNIIMLLATNNFLIIKSEIVNHACYKYM